MRTYTEVGKQAGYLPAEIDRAISNVQWVPFETTLPMCQGMCLQEAIKTANIPLSKIKRMSIHGSIQECYDSHPGFYALDVQYKNGQAQIYIADNGCEACFVASDFQPKGVI